MTTLNTLSKNIIDLSNNSSKLYDAAQSINLISDSANKLQSSIGSSKGVASFVSEISLLSKIDTKKVSENISYIADSIIKLENSLPPTSKISSLADSLSKINPVLSENATNIQQVGKMSEKHTKSFRAFLSAGALYFALKKTANYLSDFITKSNAYIENMNLFAVEMGNSAIQAEKFVSNMSNVLGLDPSNLMRYQGMFYQLSNGLGVAADNSYLMSKNLTQLTYDMASFFNLPISEMANKLESGLTGISKPLRQLGISVGEATLQTKLYSLGIQENYRNLSEASKAQLRYIQIFDSTRKMQSDLARTMITPANALRILKEQFEITSRTIGNIFIPSLTAILPYAIAALKVITYLASALASMAGFEMPKIDYSGLADVESGLEDITDSAQVAEKAIKKITAPFDELHDISEAAAAQPLGGIDIDFDLDPLYDYDATLGAITGRVDELRDKMLGWLEQLKADPVQVLADAFNSLINSFIDILGLGNLDKLPQLLTGVSSGLMAYGLTSNPILAIAVGAVTFALSGILGKEQQIELLSASLGTLVGTLLLGGIGVSPPLALALSALATSGLIELLGKDAAIDLLGSALTTLGVAFMSYKVTGDPLLSIAIGLLSGALITMTNQISDIEVLIPILGGLATALVAMEKLNLSPTSASLLGIASALLLFAGFNDFGDALNAVLYGLAGALTAIFIAMKITDSKTIGELVKSLNGFDKVLGAGFIGLGIALGLFVALNDLSPELTIELGLLAGAFTGLGTAILIGGGPLGILVGALTGAVTSIVSIATGLSKDAIPAVERFNDTISKSTQDALNPFMDAFDSITVQLIIFKDTGIPITQEFANSVSSDFKTMADSIISETERAKNQALANLRELYGEDAEAYETEYARLEKVFNAKKDELKKLEEAQAEYNINAALMYGADSEEYRLAVESWNSQNSEKLLSLQSTVDEMGKNFDIEKEKLAAIAPEYVKSKDDISKTFDDRITDTQKMVDDTNKIILDGLANDGIITQEGFNEIERIRTKAFDEGITVLSKNAEEEETIYKLRNENAKRLAIDQSIEVMKIAEQRSADALNLLKEDNRKWWGIKYVRIDDAKSAIEQEHAAIMTAARKHSGEYSDFIDEDNKTIKNKMETSNNVLIKIFEYFSGDVKEIAKRGLRELSYGPLSPEQWENVGINSAHGLFQGLNKNISKDIASWGSSLISNIKKSLDIHSPSGIFRDEIGINLALGIIEGLESKGRDITNSIGNIMSDVVENSNNSFNQLLTDTNNTISQIQNSFSGLQIKNVPIEFDPKIDYMSLMNQITAKGDLMTAADYVQLQQLELQRNAKIEALDLKFDKTDLFAQDGLFGALVDLQKSSVDLQKIDSEKTIAFYDAAIVLYEKQNESIFNGFAKIDDTIKSEFEGISIYVVNIIPTLLNIQDILIKINEAQQSAQQMTAQGIQQIISAINGIRVNIINNYISNQSDMKKLANIQQFANGGMPHSADLFFANENGKPEMVGSYGNNTAVANNDQIIEGIASGVEEGMQYANRDVVDALRALIDIATNIYDKPALSDIDVANANTRGANKRGVNMSKNPAFTY